MIRLAATDMDGTFLDSHGGFDRDLAREVLAQARDAGIQVVACTGKQCERVEELFEGVWDDLWILGDSATRIRHRGETSWEAVLDRGLALRLLGRLEAFDPGLTLIACAGATAHVREVEPEQRRAVVRRSYRDVAAVTSWDELPDGIVKITVFDPEQRSSSIVADLAPDFAAEAYLVDSDPRWVDIARLGVDKGHTLALLQERLGVPVAQTIAFGDGVSDLALFARAGFPVAVGNAVDAVKDAAAFVVGTNDESAVPHTLRRFAAAQA